MTGRGVWAAGGAGRIAVVVVLALPLLWLAFGASLAGVVARRNPTLALSWWPWSADAAAAESSRILMDQPSPAGLARAAKLAGRALDRQPVHPVAARSAAIAAAYRDPRSPGANALMTYGEKLSRHDPQTQLWFIETRVQNGDVAGALVHYDRALRTSPQVREQLIPILVAAADDIVVARPLVRLLLRQPVWRYDFVTQLMTQSNNPTTLALLLPASGLSAASQVDRALIGAALGRMVELGAAPQAYGLYRRLGGRVPAGGERINGGDFAHDPWLQPFDWAFTSEDGVVAAREADEQGASRLRVSVDAGAAGVAARQTLMLEPGRYRLRARVAQASDSGSRLSLRLACVGGDTLLDEVRRGDMAGGTVTVSAGCRAAVLSIEVQGGIDGPPSDYLVRGVSLSPA